MATSTTGRSLALAAALVICGAGGAALGYLLPQHQDDAQHPGPPLSRRSAPTSPLAEQAADPSELAAAPWTTSSPPEAAPPSPEDTAWNVIVDEEQNCRPLSSKGFDTPDEIIETSVATPWPYQVITSSRYGVVLGSPNAPPITIFRGRIACLSALNIMNERGIK